MSFIGIKPIYVSKSLDIKKYKNFIILKGVFGHFKIKIENFFQVIFINQILKIKLLKKNNFIKAYWGTFRILINNTIQGLFKLHLTKIKFVGVGYKANLKKNLLIFRLGFSHKIFILLPKFIKIIKIKKRPPTFILKSVDFNILKTTSFIIQSFKKPEPYKGKGILFLNQYLKLKEGKKTKK